LKKNLHLLFNIEHIEHLQKLAIWLYYLERNHVCVIGICFYVIWSISTTKILPYHTSPYTGIWFVSDGPLCNLT